MSDLPRRQIQDASVTRQVEHELRFRRRNVATPLPLLFLTFRELPVVDFDRVFVGLDPGPRAAVSERLRSKISQYGHLVSFQ